MVKTALLGTDRSPLSTQTIDFLTRRGIYPNADPAQNALKAAAVLGRFQRLKAKESPSIDPLPHPCPTDNGEYCNPITTRLLDSILQGTHVSVWPEFVTLTRKYKRLLPPRSLPDIFENPTFLESLLEDWPAMIGQRGIWLMQQNPDWLIHLPVENWETAHKKQRLSAVRWWRKTLPAQGLRHIQSIWSEESWQTRLDFLKLMRINLSLADAPFLESCLEDPRREIRTEATVILADLPGSSISEKICRHILSWIAWKQGALKMKLPDTPDEISGTFELPFTEKMAGPGLKVSLLCQLISRIPPVRWSVHFEKSPVEILAAFHQHEWGETLTVALFEALVRFPEETWMTAAIEYLDDQEGTAFFAKLPIRALMERIPELLFQTYVRSKMTETDGLPPMDSVFLAVLMFAQHPWLDVLALWLTGSFQNWLASVSPYSKAWSQYQALLQTAAHKIRPEMIGAIREDWPADSLALSLWSRDIREFLSTLQFRKELAESFEFTGGD